MGNERYTDKQLLSLLRDKYDELGHVPSLREIRADKTMPTDMTIRKHFGCMLKAYEAAGIDVSKIPGKIQNYSTEELRSLLKQAYKQFGRVPYHAEMCLNNGYPSVWTFVKRFGSWEQALIEAGIDPHEIQKNKTKGGGRKPAKYKRMKCISGKAEGCHGTFNSELSPVTGRPQFFMCIPCRARAKTIQEY